VTVKGLGLTGAEAERILRHTYKIQVELSDVYNVLFLITLGDSMTEVAAMVAALKDMAVTHNGTRDFSAINEITRGGKHPVAPEQVISPREALFGNTCMVPFDDAVGKICAEIVTFYPPGIPMLCPGERITQEILDYCHTLQNAGLHISGPEDYLLNTIKVVD